MKIDGKVVVKEKTERQSPPIKRTSMCYCEPASGKLFPLQWRNAKNIRRGLFFILVACTTWFGWDKASIIFDLEGPEYLKIAIIIIFTMLFGWISSSFWTCILGFFTLLRKEQDPLSVQVPPATAVYDIHQGTKVAIVMPVYNEEISRIYSAFEMMYTSLKKTNQLSHFDFFILSDTTNPELRIQEEAAWENLCRDVDGFGRIFYRRRKIRIHKKSGNISDFCRRWGKLYDYMIPLDADSLMSGQLMVDLVRTMESREDIGILQTLPKGIHQRSLISRINQFASHLYGPLLSAGSHFWQLDEAGFWGHNAIIRLKPFIKYCALPREGGFGPFAGEILSHDFIEAAFMRRAGWGVWLAYNLEGSYEEFPPNLLRELERDFRWCRGNLQHLRLVGMKGLAFGHRLLFLNGNMFYLSAFLWFVLLVLMTVYSTLDYFHTPEYFPVHHSLFPQWPTHHRELSMNLLGVTAFVLFFPKVLSILWAVVTGRSALFGGVFKLFLSVCLETVASVLLAPIRMLFHTWCVVASVLGVKLDWKQNRHFKRTSFIEAVKAHWMGSILAIAWAYLAFEVSETLFLWMSLVLIPLVLAILISILLSSPRLGLLFKKWGIFYAPVEVHPPQEFTK